MVRGMFVWALMQMDGMLGRGLWLEPLFLHWLEVHHPGPFTLFMVQHHKAINVVLGWGLSSQFVPWESNALSRFLSYCSTMIKYLELPLALEHRRLARIPNSAPSSQKQSLDIVESLWGLLH